MNKLRFLLIFLMILSFFGCYEPNGPHIPNDPMLDKDNTWRNKEIWGTKTNTLDFSSKTSLLHDNRVHEIYKKNIPYVIDEYVLWRVSHDGSCWFVSLMTQLFYQIVESGEVGFDKTVEHIKEIFAMADKKVTGSKENQAVIKNFLQILEVIKEKMDHKFTLEFRNHANVSDALCAGFRLLLESFYNPKGEKDLVVDPNKWENIIDFALILPELGLKYARISSDGDLRKGIPATFHMLDLIQYLSKDELAIIRSGNKNKIKELFDNKKMPEVMSFRSRPGYMDVAVLKSFSDKILTLVGK